MKIVDLETWNRRRSYEYFRTYDQPHFSITANLNVTRLHAFTRAESLPFSLVTLFHSIAAANSIREFRIRLDADSVVEFDRVEATQTVASDDGTFSFAYFETRDDVFSFVANGIDATQKYREMNSLDVAADRLDLLYYSVIPWISFTSFTNAMKRDGRESIPRLVFGKIFEDRGQMWIPHAVEVHHAIMDGLHVGQYFASLQENFDGV